jgi:hypothetical protein
MRPLITMNHFLEKAASGIDGDGIFTTKAIKNGVEFYVVPMAGWSTLPRSHFAKIGDELWVNDPDILNWVNHSCNPSAELLIKEKKSPLLRAIRDIAPNEEITVDYNKTETDGVKVPCTCKDEKCRHSFLRVE